MSHPNAPLVSVLLTTYNRPEFLNQAVASVLDQTFTDYEIIVVDDGSDLEAVQRYQLSDRVRLIRQVRRGRAAYGRNAGIRAASGKYLALMDDDDIWLPGKLEAQVKALEARPEAGLTYCHYTFVDDSLSTLALQKEPEAYPHDALRWMLHHCFILSPSCVLIRRDVMIECGMFDENLVSCCDWDAWIRIASRYPLHAEPERLVLYRRHEGQISLRKGTMRIWDAQVLENALSTVKAEHPRLTVFARRRLSFALRSVVRYQMQYEDDLSVTGQFLYRAWRAWPWATSTYGLALKLRKVRRRKLEDRS